MPAISPQDCRAQILALLPPALHDGFTKSGTIEFCANLGPLGRIRASLLEHQKGIAARFSPVPDPVPTPADLHLPEAAARFTELRSGLVIVTGPRGSGRTTAIASLVNDINRTSQKHIVVLDETLEHSITSHTSFVSQRKIGEHAVSSSAAMRATLRQDADVIVAGNLGTPDATNAALTAAEMGHLVFGECSSHNAADTLSRLVEQYPDDRRTAVFRALSMNLRAILCLDLAPNADGKVYRIAANPAKGRRFDSIIIPGRRDRTPEDKSWNGTWEFACKTTLKKARWNLNGRVWTAWFRIPFSDFGIKAPEAGEKWGFNIGRDRRSPYMIWKNGRSATAPKGLGEIVF